MLPKILYEPLVFDKSKYDVEKELQYWEELVEQVKLYKIQNDPEFDFENVIFNMVPVSQALTELVSIETSILKKGKQSRVIELKKNEYKTEISTNIESKPLTMCLTVS